MVSGLSGAENKDCGSGVTHCLKTELGPVVVQSCAPVSTQIEGGCTTNEASMILCYCNTDLCNPAVRFVSSWSLMAFGLIVAIRMY